MHAGPCVRRLQAEWPTHAHVHPVQVWQAARRRAGIVGGPRDVPPRALPCVNVHGAHHAHQALRHRGWHELQRLGRKHLQLSQLVQEAQVHPRRAQQRRRVALQHQAPQGARLVPQHPQEPPLLDRAKRRIPAPQVQRVNAPSLLGRQQRMLRCRTQRHTEAELQRERLSAQQRAHPPAHLRQRIGCAQLLGLQRRQLLGHSLAVRQNEAVAVEHLAKA